MRGLSFRRVTDEDYHPWEYADSAKKVLLGRKPKMDRIILESNHGPLVIQSLQHTIGRQLETRDIQPVPDDITFAWYCTSCGFTPGVGLSAKVLCPECKTRLSKLIGTCLDIMQRMDAINEALYATRLAKKEG